MFILKKSVNELNKKITDIKNDYDRKLGDVILMNKDYCDGKIKELLQTVNECEDSLNNSISDIEGLKQEVKLLSGSFVSDINDIKSGISQKNISYDTTFSFLQKENDRLNSSINKISDRMNEISGKYYQTVREILDFNKEMFMREMFLSGSKEKIFEDMKKKQLQPLLEAKWEKEKQEKGERIINAGEKIINRYNELHSQMLLMEKRGENVDKIKEQLKSFTWILEEIKK